MALPQRRQVDAVAVAPGDHCQACKAAFGRLGLQNQGGTAPDQHRGLQHAVGKFHAIPGLEIMRGATDVVERVEDPLVERPPIE